MTAAVPKIIPSLVPQTHLASKGKGLTKAKGRFSPVPAVKEPFLKPTLLTKLLVVGGLLASIPIVVPRLFSTPPTPIFPQHNVSTPIATNVTRSNAPTFIPFGLLPAPLSGEALQFERMQIAAKNALPSIIQPHPFFLSHQPTFFDEPAALVDSIQFDYPSETLPPSETFSITLPPVTEEEPPADELELLSEAPPQNSSSIVYAETKGVSLGMPKVRYTHTLTNPETLVFTGTGKTFSTKAKEVGEKALSASYNVLLQTPAAAKAIWSTVKPGVDYVRWAAYNSPFSRKEGSPTVVNSIDSVSSFLGNGINKRNIRRALIPIVLAQGFPDHPLAQRINVLSELIDLTLLNAFQIIVPQR